MKVKQEKRNSLQLLNCFDKIQFINKRFYVEKLYQLVKGYKRSLGLGQAIVIIKYLELIFLSNNKYLVDQMKVSETYLIEINKNDLGTLLKDNESFSQLLAYVGLVINIIFMVYLLVEYLVFAVHQYKTYSQNSTRQQFDGFTRNFYNSTGQDMFFNQIKNHFFLKEIVRFFFSFALQQYQEVFTIPLIFISSVNKNHGIQYSLLASTYIIGLIKEDCDYDYSINSGDSMARRYSKFSVFSYTAEFILICLAHLISDDLKTLILIILFTLHLVKSIFLRLYYNRKIQKLFNICSIYCGFIASIFFIVLKINNRPANIVVLLLVILMPISIRLASFFDDNQDSWLSKQVQVIQDILFNINFSRRGDSTGDDLNQFAKESILDPIVRRIFCNNKLSEDVLVYNIICDERLGEKQKVQSQIKNQIIDKSAAQLSSYSPSKKWKSSNFNFEESNQNMGEPLSLFRQDQDIQQNGQNIKNIKKSSWNSEYFINEQTINGMIYISKEQVYGEDSNLKESISRVFQKVFAKLQQKTNSDEEEKCSFLYLIFILQVLQNHQLFLVKYYQFTQGNNSLKSQQKYYSLLNLFLSQIQSNPQFTSHNEQEKHFTNDFFVGLNYESLLKDSFIILDKAVNLKQEILQIMKLKYIQLKELILKLDALQLLRKQLIKNLNELAQLNQNNNDLQFIYSVYIESLSFTDRDIRINFNSGFSNTTVVQGAHYLGQGKSHRINYSQNIESFSRKIFNKDSGIAFVSMINEKHSIIKAVSSNFCKIFEKKEEELIDHLIETLMPHPIQKTHQYYVQKCINLSSQINLYKSLMFGVVELGYIIPIQIQLKFSQRSANSEFGITALVNSLKNAGSEYILFDTNTKKILGMTKSLHKLFFSKYQNWKTIDLQRYFPFLRSKESLAQLSNYERILKTMIVQPSFEQIKSNLEQSDSQQISSQQFNIHNKYQQMNNEQDQRSSLENLPEDFNFLLIIDRINSEVNSVRNKSNIKASSYNYFQMKINMSKLEADYLNLQYLEIFNLQEIDPSSHSIHLLPIIKSDTANMKTNRLSLHPDEIDKIVYDLNILKQEHELDHPNSSISEKNEEDENSEESEGSKLHNDKLGEFGSYTNQKQVKQKDDIPYTIQLTPKVVFSEENIKNINGQTNSISYHQNITSQLLLSQKRNIQGENIFGFDLMQNQTILSDPYLPNQIFSNSQLLNQDDVYSQVLISPKATEVGEMPFQNINQDQSYQKNSSTIPIQIQTPNKIHKKESLLQELPSSYLSINRLDDKSIQNRTTIYSNQRDSQTQLNKIYNHQSSGLNQQKFYTKTAQQKLFQDFSNKQDTKISNRHNLQDINEDEGILKDKLDQCSTHSRESSVISTKNMLYRIIKTKKSLSVMRVISIAGLICIALIIAVTIQQYTSILTIFSDQVGDLETFDWPISISSEMSLIQKNENLGKLIDSNVFTQSSTQDLQNLQKLSTQELEISFERFQQLLVQMQQPNKKRQIFQFVQNQNYTFSFLSQVVQGNYNNKNRTNCTNNGGGTGNTNGTNTGGGSSGTGTGGSSGNTTSTGGKGGGGGTTTGGSTTGGKGGGGASTGNSTSTGGKSGGGTSTGNSTNNGNQGGSGNKNNTCYNNTNWNNTNNNNNFRNNFKKINYTTNLDYGLILFSQYLYRYAFASDNQIAEQVFLQNQATALDSLNLVYNDSKENTYNQLENTQQQLDQLMIVIIIVNALCLISVFPLYSFIQKKRQQILGLFGTFNFEKLDQKINLLNKIYTQKSGSGIGKLDNTNYSKCLKGQLIGKLQGSEIRKQSVSETSKLSRINKLIIFLTLTIYCLSIIYPILNKLIASQFIDQSRENTELMQNQQFVSYQNKASIFEIKGFMLDSMGQNYLGMLLALAPGKKIMNITDMKKQLEDNIKTGNILLTNLQSSIQEQHGINRFEQSKYDSFLYKILEDNICETLQRYPEYMNEENKIDLDECKVINNGIMTKGLTISLVEFFKLFTDLQNLYQINDKKQIVAEFEQMQKTFIISDYNNFLNYLTKIISILRDFILQNSNSYFSFIKSFQLSLLFYQLIVMVLIFLFGWISFYHYLDSQIFNTKQYLSLFDINFLVENTYVYNYLKSNVNF